MPLALCDHITKQQHINQNKKNEEKCKWTRHDDEGNDKGKIKIHGQESNTLTC